MEEIKVGEYVRNESGYIHKVEDAADLMNFFIDNDGKLKEIAGVDFWNEYIYENIVNHSFNIIDLIQVGDYVNGEIINGISEEDGKRLVYHGAYDFMDEVHFRNKDIKSIVTKEQFKFVEYEV